MDTKVSVIVPVYNTSVYLQKCLDSLLYQTLKEIEIICINDGSTDNSLEILKEYESKDPRVKILNQQNQGQSSARNAGLKIAKGEYIGFLDSDDCAKPEMLEKLYMNAKEFDSEISICSIEVFDETTKCTYSNDYMSLNVFGEKFENRVFSPSETFDFIFRICVVPWNKLYKRDFLIENNLKFIENLNFEDNVFFMDTYTSAKKISIINEPLVVYTQNSVTSYSNAVKKHDIKKLDFFRIFEEEEKILKQKNIFPLLEDYFEFEKINILNYWYRKITDKDIKKEYAIRFHKLYPCYKHINCLIKFYYFLKIKWLLRKHKIVFWGASLYLEDLLKTYRIKSPNILAIVDKNEQKHGKDFCGYKIVCPSQIESLNPDFVVPAVVNIYNFDKMLKKEFRSEKICVKKVFGNKLIENLRG